MRPNPEVLPPHSPEAERGVLGCCLRDPAKIPVALRSGVTPGWFYDLRHREIFVVLAEMAAQGGGDWVVAAMRLRRDGKLDRIGGLAFLNELENAVPTAENIEYYIPDLRDHFQRRQVLDATARLQLLARDKAIDSAALVADTAWLLDRLHQQANHGALPEIVSAPEFVAADIPEPDEIIHGVLHQGSKIIVGGASKSFKTWNLVDMAVSVASGTSWLGFETTPGKVLYVNLEIQPAFFRHRIEQVAKAKAVDVPEKLELWNLRGYLNDYRCLLPKIEERIAELGHALVILDPTYKMLGTADENKATDVAALLNTIEHLAVTTGSAVAMAGHFAKGNAASKETLDRISGSGVFARDPDSLLIFTPHEEDGAFTVECVLRNFEPKPSFVVEWHWPLFQRAEDLDPERLKSSGGRPAKYDEADLLEMLGEQRLSSKEWSSRCREELGISHGKFFELLKSLEKAEKVQKSHGDRKWEQIHPKSRNSNHEKDQ
ncbi:MAG: AAA family ATPase [Verrucomicrobiia bacterium]